MYVTSFLIIQHNRLRQQQKFADKPSPVLTLTSDAALECV